MHLCSTYRLRVSIWLLCAIVLVQQMRQTHFLATMSAIDYEMMPPLGAPTNLVTSSSKAKRNHIRVCMLVRNDNQRLAEWIAYHYTTLPMREIIIGTDDHATQLVEDPMEILSRWNGTDLHYQVWKHDDYYKGGRYKGDTFRRHMRRQNRFFSECMSYFGRQSNPGWVSLSDSDEYIKLNPLDDAADKAFFNQPQPYQKWNPRLVSETQQILGPNETLWDRILARKRLRLMLGLDRSRWGERPELDSIPKVADILEEYASQHTINPCHSMSRLRYSAVTENSTEIAATACHPSLDSSVATNFNASKLVTIRFLYHVRPGQFEFNEWAKVLVDLRRIKNVTDRTNNPHRPFEECGHVFMHDVVSILRVNHYLGDVNIFVGRAGDSTNKTREHWSTIAHKRDGVTCDHIHGWLNEFVKGFGLQQAKHLLGQES